MRVNLELVGLNILLLRFRGTTRKKESWSSIEVSGMSSPDSSGRSNALDGRFLPRQDIAENRYISSLVGVLAVGVTHTVFMVLIAFGNDPIGRAFCKSVSVNYDNGVIST